MNICRIPDQRLPICTSLKAENAKLRRDLKDSRSSAGVGQLRSEEDCDPKEAVRRILGKKAPLRDLWKKYQNSSTMQDRDAGASQATRYCKALELYADVRDSPVRSPDPLCDSMDSTNEQNHRRVLQGLILWAQMGRSGP